MNLNNLTKAELISKINKKETLVSEKIIKLKKKLN